MHIFVSGGKTMGHVSPLIGIILGLKNEYDFIYFGLEGSMEEAICEKYNITFHKMNLTPFYRKNIFKNLKTFFLILKERNKIIKKYKKYSVKAIVSSGGYVSIPLILSFRKTKKILLESNSTLGLANKFLSLFVDYIGIQFDTINHKKSIMVGNPIKIFDSKFDHPLFYFNEPLVLFVGGSNGAFDIVKAAYEFNNRFPNIKIFVITGERYYDTFIFNKNAYVYKKIFELSSILNKFSLVISRAGGSTITELLLANVPFILIPSKNVSGNHQVLNAKYLESKKVCLVIDQIDNGEYITEIYNFLFDEDKKSKQLLRQKELQKRDSIELIKTLIEN